MTRTSTLAELYADSSLTLRLFGASQLFWQKQRLSAPSKKGLALLAYLSLNAAAVSKEDLLSIFWPQGQQQNVRLTLRQLRALPGAVHWLKGDNPIRLEACSDVDLFKHAVRTRNFKTALELYSGQPQEQLLKNFQLKNSPEFQTCLDHERNTVDELLCEALVGRALELEVQRESEAALDLWRKLVTLDPLNETAHRGIMRVRYRQGFMQEALAQFEICRKLFKCELEIEPSKETLTLAQSIERSNRQTPIHIKAPKRLPSSLLRPPILIGREKAWAKMEEAWSQNQSIFLSGPGGSGKTRLMMDFAKTKGDKFGPSMGKPGDKHVPFSSLTRNFELNANIFLTSLVKQWARQQLARIAPHVFPEEAEGVQAVESLSVLYQAWLHFTEAATNYFDVLIGEDIHFFDAASMEAANYAFAHLHGSNRLTSQQAKAIVTYRPAEMPPNFIEMLKPLVEQGVLTIIELQPFPEVSTAKLLNSLELPNAASLTPHIHRLSGGNPQLILEAVKSFHETGSLTGTPKRIELTDKLEAIIQKRIANLSEPALKLAQTLAVFQQKTEPEWVMEVLELDPFKLSEHYQELERVQMIEDGFFVHDLIYEVAQRNTPELLKRLLHKRIARILEKYETEPARIAEHWYAAGETQLALPWRYRAAELALQQGLTELAGKWLSEIGQTAKDTSLRSKALKLHDTLTN